MIDDHACQDWLHVVLATYSETASDSVGLLKIAYALKLT